MTFDDGSTLDYATAGTAGAATAAPAGMLLTDYASNFKPGNLSPGATSLYDVLAMGIGRIADYKTASLAAQNPQPQYSAQAVQPQEGGDKKAGMGNLLLIAGVVLAAVVLLRK